MKKKIERGNLTPKDLKSTAINILMSSKYTNMNGMSCAEYVTKTLKKNPNLKGKQFYIDKN